MPCDAKAFDELRVTLDIANGRELDWDKDQAKIEAAKQELLGKSFALTGCTFKLQGTDEIHFGAVAADGEITCIMKDGEAGVKAFREAAMAIDIEKLRLDVRGMVAKTKGANGFEHVELTDCEISAH